MEFNMFNNDLINSISLFQHLTHVNLFNEIYCNLSSFVNKPNKIIT